MREYRAFLSRTITTTQHAVIVVQSSSEEWARRDILAAKKEWESDAVVSAPVDIVHIQEIK